MTRPAINVDELSSEERLDLIERLWDSLGDGDVPLTDAQRQELDRRLDRLDAEGPVGVSWEHVRAQMRGQ